MGFFFHRKTDLSILGLIRIGYATLLLINLLTWWPNLERWFGETGVMTLEVSRQAIDQDTITLFQWLPTTPTTLWICYGLLLFNAVALLLGIFTRLQLASIFILYTSFVHRNILIFDGEDIMFRLMSFYLIFSPAGKYFSVERLWTNFRNPDSATNIQEYPIWPLRLIQIQTASIVFFSCIEKLKGTQWVDGTALYYVSRLDDLFYRMPVPNFIFESLLLISLITWATLVLEFVVPIAVWFPRTRRIALAMAFLFHLSLDYMMNLNLFQWIMMLGWCSFIRPCDLAAIRRCVGWRKQNDGEVNRQFTEEISTLDPEPQEQTG